MSRTKKDSKKHLHITTEDYILAVKRADRELENETKTGFVSKHKIHKTKRKYNRKDKSWKSEF